MNNPENNAPKAPNQPEQYQPTENNEQKSPKSNVVAFILCFFIGALGVHRFYVGKIGSGVAQLLTLGGLFIWSFIDFIMIICGKFTDKDGKTLKW